MKGYIINSNRIKFLKILKELDKTLENNEINEGVKRIIRERREDIEEKIQKNEEEGIKWKLKNGKIPRGLGRVRYEADPQYLENDIGAGAILDVNHYVNLSKEKWKDLLGEMMIDGKYKLHPSLINLYESRGKVKHQEDNGSLINFNIPKDGEVMYVIGINYELILAARSQNQTDFPHPTLLGGRPEVLSAGIVEFKDNRIVRLEINGSGHFKPNSDSSIEVSLGVFLRLPPDIFHENCRINVFEHVTPDYIKDLTTDSEVTKRKTKEINKEKRIKALPLIVIPENEWGKGMAPFSIKEEAINNKENEETKERIKWVRTKLKCFNKIINEIEGGTVCSKESQGKISKILFNYIKNPYSSNKTIENFFTKEMKEQVEKLRKNIASFSDQKAKMKHLHSSTEFNVLKKSLFKILEGIEIARIQEKERKKEEINSLFEKKSYLLLVDKLIEFKKQGFVFKMEKMGLEIITELNGKSQNNKIIEFLNTISDGLNIVKQCLMPRSNDQLNSNMTKILLKTKFTKKERIEIKRFALKENPSSPFVFNMNG